VDDSSRAEQQVIAKQAAISHLDRRISELKEKKHQVESQQRAEARSLRDQKIATWWRAHPDIKTDHLETRKTVLFWLALVAFVLILLRIRPLTEFVTTRYAATDFGSAQQAALFLGGAAVGVVLLLIVFLLYYSAIFLLPFVEIPRMLLRRQQRQLNEQRMAISRQAEQESAQEMEAKYAPALASIDREIAEAETHMERLKRDMDRLAMEM